MSSHCYAVRVPCFSLNRLNLCFCLKLQGEFYPLDSRVSRVISLFRIIRRKLLRGQKTPVDTAVVRRRAVPRQRFVARGSRTHPVWPASKFRVPLVHSRSVVSGL